MTDEEAVLADVRKLIVAGHLQPTDAQIWHIVEALLNKFNPEILRQPTCVEVDELVEALGYRIRYERLSKTDKIMGATCFTDTVLVVLDNETLERKEIFVERHTVVLNSLLTEPRYKGRYAFTVAHEIAHIVFDNEDIRRLKALSRKKVIDRCAEEISCTAAAFMRKHGDEEQRADRAEQDYIERLCDKVASAILMPDKTVNMLVQGEIAAFCPTRGCNVLHVQGNEKDVRFVLGLVAKIAEVYGASREAAGYKLSNTRLVRGAREILEVNNVIKKQLA
jgi:Zn-dependent peptidase ImmA (M78 family)